MMKISMNDTKISGIYKIVNTVNGKYYIGSSSDIFTTNVHGRLYRHKRNLKQNIHHNDHLQRAWNKYGENAFDFIVVKEVEEKDLLLVEQEYLDIAKKEQNKCYNLIFKAGGGPPTEYVKEKISKTIRAKNWVGENSPNFGMRRSEETKKKISESTRGINKGTNNPAYKNAIHNFVSISTGETFLGTMYDFYTKYNLDIGGVSKLVLGKHKSTKGWSLA
jgi:group I intron endonuclease